MSYDDNDLTDNPVEGLGDEILPDRGMPFDDVTDEGVGEEEIEVYEVEGPDLSPEELASLQGVSEIQPETIDLTDGPPTGESGPGPDSGMGAAFPILSEGELDTINLPEEEIAIGGLPAFDKSAFAPADIHFGLKGTEDREGSAHLDEEEDMLNFFVTEERLKRLWERIDLAQGEIKEHIPSLPIARNLYDQVERARNELLAGRKNFEETERTVNEVELRIAAVLRSGVDKSHAIMMLVYELAWTIVLVALAIVFAASTQPLTIAILSAIIGGVGGIVGALWALWRHAARDMDYSRQYSMWYITTPILGMILGVFVYGMIGAGLIYWASGSTEISSPSIIYILAFVVGYQQNVALDLMRRILRVFRLEEDEGNNLPERQA